MAKFSVKRTIGRGIALALPLGIVFYVLIKFIEIFEKAIAPLVKKFGVDTIFGGITVTVFAILAILVITFLLGLLMQLSFVSKIRKHIEELILKFFPAFNHLKLMAAEKFDLENATHNWKPVLVLKGEQYLPAYLIEENQEWITLALTKPPSTEPRDMLIIKKNLISYKEITLKQMDDYNKHFGKGYLSLTN